MFIEPKTGHSLTQGNSWKNASSKQNYKSSSSRVSTNPA